MSTFFSHAPFRSADGAVNRLPSVPAGKGALCRLIGRAWSVLMLFALLLAPAAHAVAGQQYSAGGHALNFAPGHAVFAGGSHALWVDFIGAEAVLPQGPGQGGCRADAAD